MTRKEILVTESYDAQRQSGLAVPRPSPALLDVVRVHELCRHIEQQLPTVTDVPSLEEAKARLAAIAEYVRSRSKSGLNQLSSTRLKVAARVGELLGDEPPARGRPAQMGIARDPLALSKNLRRRSRTMAKHPEMIDEATAASSDEHPVSERKVLATVAANSNASRLEERWKAAVGRYPFVDIAAPRDLSLASYRAAVLASVVEIDRASTVSDREARIARLHTYVERKLAGSTLACWSALAPAVPAPRSDDPLLDAAREALHEIAEIAQRLPVLFAALDAYPAVNEMAGPWPAIVALRAAWEGRGG